MNKRYQEVKNEKRWVNNRKKNYLKRMISGKQWIISTPQQEGKLFKMAIFPAIFSLQQLDAHMRMFVPSLFSKIAVTKDEVVVEVPYQVASKIVKHLQDHCCLGIPVKINGT